MASQRSTSGPSRGSAAPSGGAAFGSAFCVGAVQPVPPASQSSGLRIQLLHAGEDVAIVCGSRHPLALRKTVEAADLLSYPLVIPPLSTLFRESVEQFMDAHKLPRTNVRIESGSMTATNTILRETFALGFYSPHLAQHYGKHGWLRVLPLQATSVRVPIGCFWLRGVEPDATARLLVGHLRDVAVEFLTKDGGKLHC